MKGRSLVLMGLAALMSAGTVTAQAPITTVAKGDMSEQQVARQVVVRTPAEWTALWKDHAPGQPPPAQIDFNKQMVIGIFAGTKPSAGHEVEIVGVRSEANELVVEYVQKQPGRGTMAAQLLTAPFHLISVPRHAGSVTFLEVRQTANGKR